MNDAAIPPDATIFKSGGQTYFLYMGALEMRALQREWGLTRSGVDSSELWDKKLEQYEDRIRGGAMEDKLAIIRHGLTRWAQVGGNGSGPVELDDEKVAAIVAGMEQPGPRRVAPFVLINQLHKRFYWECFGFPELGKDATPSAGPKEPKQKGSIQSTS